MKCEIFNKQRADIYKFLSALFIGTKFPKIL